MSAPLPELPALPQLGAPQRRPPAGGARRTWQRAVVEQVRVETAHARTFRLLLPQRQQHVAGQSCVVRLTAPDGYTAQRSYSIASPPQDDRVELTVERLADGEVSGYLHDHVAAGDELEVRGPFGGWFTWRGDRAALLVGGGSGVVPLACVLRTRAALAADGGDPPPVHLVVSARTRTDLFYADELLAPGRGAGQGVTAVLTREPAPGAPAGSPARGRLRAEDLAPHAAAAVAGDADVYVCGSTGFTTAAERLLQDVGVPAAAIRVERFGPS